MPAYALSASSSLWPPYRPLVGAPEPLVAHSTAGVEITLVDGRTLLDGMASWWTACHGYNHSHLLACVEAQLHRMPHVMFGGLSHEPARTLATRLLALWQAPAGGRVFFSDSGSVAVEVALKMAVQFWRNGGKTARTRFVSFAGAYHGDTLGCMALADPEESFHAPLKGYIPTHVNVPIPHDAALQDAFIRTLDRHRETLAGVIIEPLVQGAGGMRFHAPEVLAFIAKACRDRDLILIADEVFTGFGRLGTMFACEQAKVVPDILCLGKGLTGGVIGLAATLAHPRIVAGFSSPDPRHALMHGPTYMANPLACAAANASLDLFEREPRLSQAQGIAAGLAQGLAPCRDLAGVRDVRVKGAVGVVEVCRPLSQEALRNLQRTFLAHNVWIRPFGNIVYLTPALVMREDECARLTRAVVEGIAEKNAREGAGG